jgi:hypothetical protein
MSDHEILWEFDIDMVRAEAVCHAHADARCHQVPSCDCESWDEQEDEDGYFHEIEGEQHRHRQVDYCGIITWLNVDSPLDCAADDAQSFQIGRTPIEPVWGDGYMQWRPTLHDWEIELLAGDPT